MGGIACSLCSPVDEALLRLLAVEDATGRLQWSDADASNGSVGGGETDPFGPTGGGAGGRGAGEEVLGGGAAQVDEWSIGVPRPFSDGIEQRIDPPVEMRIASLLVSTSLDWCTCQSGGFWDRDVIVDRLAGEYEQIGVRTKFRRPPSTGSWRPLSQAYFAWLVSRVDAWNRQTGRDAGQKELIEVADAAISHRIFGEWAADERLWPRIPPYGYIGPVAYTPWDVERNAIPWDEAFEDRMARIREVLGAFSN